MNYCNKLGVDNRGSSDTRNSLIVTHGSDAVEIMSVPMTGVEKVGMITGEERWVTDDAKVAHN